MEEIKPYGVIYCLTCKVNGKVNVGQTTDFETRMEAYKNLRCRRQKLIYNALKKHGVDNFFYEIIDTATNKEQLDTLERYHMTLANSRNRKFGYNTREAGSHGKHSDESKRKTSKSMTGRKRPPRSPEWNRKISEALKGKTQTKEANIKRSISLTGRELSFDSKQKISNSLKGYNKLKESIKKQKETFNRNWTKEEHGLKISKANKGRIFTEDHKKRLAEARKGKSHSPEVKDKISESLKGKVISAETIKKRNETRKMNNENKMKIVCL
jgi:group I intron endonuclease